MHEDAAGESTASPGWTQRRERMMRDLERDALELFAERGYDEVSYEDIAERAGRSWRTVYRYYPTKEAFLLATPVRAAGLSGAAVQVLTAADYPFDRYFELLESLTATHTEDLGEVLLWARAMREVPKDVANRVRAERTAAISDSVIGLCSSSLGVPPDDIRAISTAAAIAAVNQAVVEHWIEGDGKADLGRLFEEAVDGLRMSLRPRRRANRRS